MNKEKRQELEQLHIKHNTVQSSASAAEAKADKLTRDLSDAHKRIDDLTNKLNQQETSMKELGELKSMLAKAPGASKELAVAAQVRLTQTEGRIVMHTLLLPMTCCMREKLNLPYRAAFHPECF